MNFIMKTLNRKFWTIALMAVASFAVSCSSDDDNNNDDNNDVKDGTILTGSINDDVTLTSGNTYYLSGEYIVEEGATLNIEPGVTIIAKYDDIVDYILVKQGAKINATGTSDSPIVMTSEQKRPGAWGGIHICGRARTNAEGGVGYSEIGGAEYGGNEDNDNSGTLRYVRIEYSGFAFDEEHEANGITFYGVGSGTTVEYCQAYKGSDDGFEFFGGSVNISNMVVVSCSDDSYDWTEGWNGTGKNLIAYQEIEETLGYDCDCLIEADNNENNYNALPVSHPVLSGLYLVGNNSNEGKRGIRLRRGTEVEIKGAWVCGKANALTLESEQTETSLLNNVSKLSNVHISSQLKNEKGIYTDDMFVEDGNFSEQEIPYSTPQTILNACSWADGWSKW